MTALNLATMRERIKQQLARPSTRLAIEMNEMLERVAEERGQTPAEVLCDAIDNRGEARNG